MWLHLCRPRFWLFVLGVLSIIIQASLVTALENANYYNDDNTGNHIKRVQHYSELLAKLRGMEGEFVKRIAVLSSLHDVGKVGLSDELLKKPGKYSQAEFEAMKEHVLIGERMLKSSAIDEMAWKIARYHHERWDGTGYIEGLKGEAIPLEARIVSVVDVFDALSTKRPYKDPFPQEKIDAIMKEGRAG